MTVYLNRSQPYATLDGAKAAALAGQFYTETLPFEWRLNGSVHECWIYRPSLTAQDITPRGTNAGTRSGPDAWEIHPSPQVAVIACDLRA